MNMLISRMLDFGVMCPTFMQGGVFKSYAKMPIPDEKLVMMDHEELVFYTRSLYLCSCESARDWAKGHSRLETIGFKKISREAGHRVFTSMEYRGKEE